MLADYHVIRKAKLKVNDLYTGNSSSIYWFNKGVNWRAIVAFLAGVWPLLRKDLPNQRVYRLITLF
jgi:NCS1 family nucleobase:cation symporter-1